MITNILGSECLTNISWVSDMPGPGWDGEIFGLQLEKFPQEDACIGFGRALFSAKRKGKTLRAHVVYIHDPISADITVNEVIERWVEPYLIKHE